MISFVKRGDVYNVPIMEIYGLSTDDKPTHDESGMAVPNASIFYEIDTGQEYMFNLQNKIWLVQPSESGGSGSSAGFGTPTASATQLESTEQPTVSIEASGPNTAKVFDFKFGIPKGRDGNPGDPGAAAGFGAVTATATQLASGQQPTVQAEWSGPDTAKNMTLTFGIPAGQPGPAYELTPEDKQAIVQDVLAALPNAEGVGF